MHHSTILTLPTLALISFTSAFPQTDIPPSPYQTPSVPYADYPQRLRAPRPVEVMGVLNEDMQCEDDITGASMQVEHIDEEISEEDLFDLNNDGDDENMASEKRKKQKMKKLRKRGNMCFKETREYYTDPPRLNEIIRSPSRTRSGVNNHYGEYIAPDILVQDQEQQQGRGNGRAGPYGPGDPGYWEDFNYDATRAGGHVEPVHHLLRQQENLVTEQSEESDSDDDGEEYGPGGRDYYQEFDFGADELDEDGGGVNLPLGVGGGVVGVGENMGVLNQVLEDGVIDENELDAMINAASQGSYGVINEATLEEVKREQRAESDARREKLTKDYEYIENAAPMSDLGDLL
ncbi:hypothetical protein ABW20_dc0100873 [Dactylellina cionopaga]|nr:hypothetical protein ABW20_dc0100873 [Dactylellina cionopaga]